MDPHPRPQRRHAQARHQGQHEENQAHNEQYIRVALQVAVVAQDEQRRDEEDNTQSRPQSLGIHAVIVRIRNVVDAMDHR